MAPDATRWVESTTLEVRIRRSSNWGVFFVFLSLLPRAARAQASASAPPPVFIELTSRDACGSSEELGRRVAQRSERIRLASGPSGATVAQAEIQSAGGSVNATLTIIEPAGKRWSRQVHSGTCEEALDAIALVLAVALDPQLTSSEPIPGPPPPPPRARQPEPPKPQKAPPPEPPPPAPPPAEPATQEPPPPPPPEPPVIRTPPPPDRAPEPAAVSPARGTFAMAGAAGLFSWGPAPRAMPGISAFAVVGYQRGSVFSPALQLRAAHFWLDGFAAPGGVADFELDSVALSVCPIWLQEHRLVVHLCAAGEVGRLAARGTQTIMPQSAVRLFAVLGGSAAVMFDLGLGIHLTGMVGGGAPLVRDSFQFRPEVFYEIPSVVLTTGAGIGMRFL